MTNYELDMVTVNCSRRLSPICEADPLIKTAIPGSQSDEEYQAADQHDYAGHLAKSITGKP